MRLIFTASLSTFYVFCAGVVDFSIRSQPGAVISLGQTAEDHHQLVAHRVGQQQSGLKLSIDVHVPKHRRLQRIELGRSQRRAKRNLFPKRARHCVEKYER